MKSKVAANLSRSAKIVVEWATLFPELPIIPGTGLAAQRGNYAARNEWRGVKLTISTEPDTVEAVR